jgi:hypothetical protein
MSRETALRKRTCRRIATSPIGVFTLALCLVVWLGPVGAQATAEIDPLVLPNAVLLCRAKPVTPADSAVFVFHYVDPVGTNGRRTTSIAFDSIGQPLYIVVTASQADINGDPLIYTVFARFFPKALGGRVNVRNQRASPTDSLVPHPVSVKQDLTNGDIARAKDLADWFWAHRCKNSTDFARPDT